MDVRYQTSWRRFAAAVIDSLLFWPLSRLLRFTSQTASFPIVTFLALLLDALSFLAYSIYMHGRFGQTIGKWFMKVEVISIDEGRLTMRQAVRRDSVPLAFTVLYLLFAIGPVFSGTSPYDREFEQGVLSFLAHAGLVWTALELGTMLTNSKRRAIHDFIAGSVVVRRSNLLSNTDAREERPRAG